MKQWLASASILWRSPALAILAVGQIATFLLFYSPVSTVYLASRGLGYSHIFTLESILLFSIMILEIPSGIISDRIDRRWPLIAGFALDAASKVLFALAHDFFGFACSYSLSGFSIALLSGIFEAYVYEQLGESADTQAVSVFAHLSVLELLAGLLSSLAGAWLAQSNLAYPAYATAVASIMGAVLMLQLPASPAPQNEGKLSARTSWKDLLAGLRLLYNSPTLAYVTIGSSASFALFNAVYTLNQPFYQRNGLAIKYWGMFAALSLIAAAVYNTCAAAIEKKLGCTLALFSAFALAGLGFAMMILPSALAVGLGMLLIVAGMHGKAPVATALANQFIPSKQRATVLNIASSLGSLIALLLNPLIGWAADKNLLATAIAVSMALFVFATLWLVIAGKSDQKG
ncbi:MFS transporter [Bombiscardovia apis]|uniref:MFS transporter n=1 Tax=Bombiscardovia apis TaxID=2932182 RepID=A0ABM8BCS9_9BIFI|nr:MFS transporter [Bombiscardovia apis]BDR54671.1 MFS transporter [Bombiscardovia apis]